MRWMAILAVVAGTGCGFSAPNGAAVVDGTPPGDGRERDGAVPDGLVPVDSGVDAPPDAPPPPGCITNTLRASKIYIPSSTTDGVLAAQPPYVELVIPAELPIEFGNAGNHCASIELTDDDNTLVRCRYQGGADVSSTFGNLTQTLKGLRYVFDGCTTGAACPTSNGQPVQLAAGDRVALMGLSSITLKIGNGDSSQGPTVIRVGIERCVEEDK